MCKEEVIEACFRVILEVLRSSALVIIVLVLSKSMGIIESDILKGLSYAKLLLVALPTAVMIRILDWRD